MKTAVSVPDDVFGGAERLAKREDRSRSAVYSAALRDYVARHAPDEIAVTSGAAHRRCVRALIGAGLGPIMQSVFSLAARREDVGR